MGFDGFLVPDWAKPYVGYAVGMDWPEGDEDGCFRLADLCVATATKVGARAGLDDYLGIGESWDGDALEAFLGHVRLTADPALTQLVEELVDTAVGLNELGVQVQYVKRMIEVSVWFLIFQIGWLLAMAFGPWGGLSFALIGSRVQLARLTIAQLGKRLLINVGLFGVLLAGMDAIVQATQDRRDHLDWEQLMTSAGTGATLGAFLTLFTGLAPARSMWGLMGRSGLAGGASDLFGQLLAGEPLDADRLLKSFTSGVLGGADAQWASWSPGAHHLDDGSGPGGPGSGGSGDGPSASADHTAPTLEPATSKAAPSESATSLSAMSESATSSPATKPSSTTAAHAGQATVHDLSGTGNAQEIIPTKQNSSVDELINKSPDPPAAPKPGQTGPAGAHPADPSAAAREEASPFQILDDTGIPGDGYTPSGLWGRYGAAGVLIQTLDAEGRPRYLLMQQGEMDYLSNAGRWQLPGGALDSLESPTQGAAREISEELGVNQDYLDRLELVGALPIEIEPGWTYTNLAARGEKFTAKLDPYEVSSAKWFTAGELAGMANEGSLHPALAEALPELLSLYDGDAHPSGRTAPSSLADLGLHSATPPPLTGLAAEANGPFTGPLRRSDSGLLYVAPAPHVPLDAPFGARAVEGSFGEAIWADVIGNVSGKEARSITRYAGDHYTEINGLLREFGGLPPERVMRRPGVRLLVADILNLDNVVSRQPVPVSIDVVRGLFGVEIVFSVPVEELPGTVQTDPAFFSTGLQKNPNLEHDAMLRLRVPEGTPAMYAAPFSEYSWEVELLLGRGVSYFVEDVRMQDGIWQIFGWVLPRGAG
ncbi:NUDIX domain-containing protein [Nonomuraea sp. MG754425]|uniref:ADP-ribosyltransferase n=1 Tax=Nonomuraea sp. MG754425 TaxID=2570319 RepID=UPI001F31144D|nr:ADP-ribosyltransferase [Nonomuraea sp. MG754425]MCF6468988.1 NUDIX domain-containing protein [Nonomuraea sp. MG754425]